MRAAAHPSIALQTVPSTPSIRSAGSGLLAAFRRLLGALSSMSLRTTLTRDPFSAEQSRD